MDTTSPSRAEAPAIGVALYPNHYVWFVFLSTMDVLLTTVALQHGAREFNAFANYFLQQFGFIGLVMVKFTAVPIVVLLCEYIGRKKPSTGSRLVEWVVALSAVPVTVSFVLLIARVYFGL